MRAAATDESTPPLIAASTLIRYAPRCAERGLAGPGHRAGQHRQHGIDVGVDAGVPQRQSQRAAGGWPGRHPSRSARATAAATPAVHAEPVEHSIPLASSSISSESPSQPREGEVRVAGQSVGSRDPLRRCPRSPASTPSMSRSRSAAAARCWPPMPSDGDRERGGHPDGAGDIGCAGTDVTLLATAVRQRHTGHVAPQQQRARPGRAAELVRGQAHRRQPAGGEIDRQLPRPPAPRRVCIGTPNSAATAASSAIGMTVPTSLLAHITDTSATSSGSLQRVAQRGR